MAEAAGKPVVIPHETAIKTREFIANDIAAWASYQPAFDKIINCLLYTSPSPRDH